MGNFNRNNRSRGGDRRGGFRDRPEMHNATCADCGDNCKVPFRPTGDKPVYCSECFENQGGGNSRRFDNNRSDRRDKQMHAAICDTCGSNCEVPFRPTGDKPLYCDNCFSKTDRKGGRGKDSNLQIDSLNEKLDIIIALLSKKDSKSEKEEVKEEKPKAKSITKKKAVEKPKAKAKSTTKKKTAAKPKAKAKTATKKKAPAKKKATTKKKTTKK